MSDTSESTNELDIPAYEEPQFELMPSQFEPIASAPSSPSGAVSQNQIQKKS